MANSKVSDDRKAFDRITKELALLQDSYVLVGFQEGSVTHAQNKDQRTKKPGLSMPEIAAANEFGTDDIPARPFMRTSYDDNKAQIDRVITKEYDKIVDGQSTVKRSLGLIGLFMVDLIQQKIRAITTPPNAPSTIKKKKSSKPLIDFGQMISAVTSKVVLK